MCIDRAEGSAKEQDFPENLIRAKWPTSFPSAPIDHHNALCKLAPVIARRS